MFGILLRGLYITCAVHKSLDGQNLNFVSLGFFVGVGSILLVPLKLSVALIQAMHDDAIES